MKQEKAFEKNASKKKRHQEQQVRINYDALTAHLDKVSDDLIGSAICII